MRLKHPAFENDEPNRTDLAVRLSSLQRTVREPEVGYRIAVSLAVLLLTPVVFECLVRTIPESWLLSIGLNSARSWLGMVLFLIVTPAVVAGVGYSTAQSERANRLTPELVTAARLVGHEWAESELRLAAETLRAASQSRWCDGDVRRDAADEAMRLQRLIGERQAYPIPATPAIPDADQLPRASDLSGA